jgi:hypothetical protein
MRIIGVGVVPVLFRAPSDNSVRNGTGRYSIYIYKKSSAEGAGGVIVLY